MWWIGYCYLALLVLGLLLDVGLLVRLLVRPVRWPARERRVLSRRWDLEATARLLFWLTAWYLAAVVVRPAWAAMEERRTLWIVLHGLAFNLIGLIVVAASLRRRGTSWAGAFGLQTAQAGPAAGLGALFYIAILPLLWFYTLVYQAGLKAAGYETPWQEVAIAFASEPSAAVRWLLVALAVVLAPVFEELLFRGIALPLIARRWGAAPAVIAVSAAFALIHLHVPSLVPLFLIAVGFSLGYLFTRSLWTPIVMHAMFNGVNLLLLSLMH